MYEQKRRTRKKKNILPFVSRKFHMIYCLLPAVPTVPLAGEHTDLLRESVFDNLSWNCSASLSWNWRRMAFTFRCFPVFSVKYRSPLGVVAHLWVCPGFCPAFLIFKRRLQITKVTLCGTLIASASSICIWLSLTDQQLFKLLTQLNAFVETSHSTE